MTVESQWPEQPTAGSILAVPLALAATLRLIALTEGAHALDRTLRAV